MSRRSVLGFGQRFCQPRSFVMSISVGEQQAYSLGLK